MSWFVVMQIFSVVLEWVKLGRRSEQEKDLEILLLRHQLAILERKQRTVVRVARTDQLILMERSTSETILSKCYLCLLNFDSYSCVCANDICKIDVIA
jgi:hypothetical protein